MKITSLLSTLFLLFIRLYRITLSPFVGQHCRFEPSCSHYAEDAIHEHGPIKGFLLTTHRLCRCHPWCEGGYDPVHKKTHKVES